MKNIIFILILIFCSTFLFSQTIIPGGNVSGNWSISGSPYLVEGEITIPDGQTLTIDPGCLIEFQGHYKFNIQGRLLSIGTEQDSIRFTINDTTGFYIPHVPDGGWDGLHFESLITVNDSSKIKYSIFEYGKAIGSYYENSRGGAIKCYSNFCRLIIENCLFINNYSSYFGGAIYCCISNVKIIGNRFENNLSSSRGGAVSYTSAGEISNNLFVNNRAGYGGALYLTHSSCIVNGNKFTNNYSYHGGAVCLYNSNDDLVLINNIMCNNSARFGGGCYFFQTDGILINNTIVNNHDWFAGGLHFAASNGLVNVYNSIIYGNDCQYGFMQVMIDYGGSDPNFYNCNIQGGIEGFSIYGDDSNYVGDYIDNIDYPPMFVDPSSGTGNDVIGYDADWSLLSSSVCINHGIVDTTGLNLPDTDYAGNPRIYCGIDPRVDIGAYEYQGEPDPIPGIMINPKLLDFGIHTINTTSEVKNISIWNIGFSSLEINNITASAGFLIKRDNYPQFGSFITPFSVEPDSTEIINVIFEPLAAGYYEDNIVIYSNDSNFPVSYVNVNGIGDNWPIFQGVLEEDTFWDTDTVKVIGSVIVDSGVTLCVEPGTNVQIFEDCSLFIQGSIIAEGTIDDSIIFTGVQNYYYADCWGGLKFNQTPTINDSSKFNYCIFSNSKSDFGGALFIQDFSKVYFKNCTFKYNIAEQDNNCGYGGGMTLMNSSPLISNCVFKNNIASGGWYSFGRGGGIAIINSSPIITNCIFSNNTAEGGYPNNCGGGIYCVSCSNLVISETVISNNSAGYNTGYDWSGGGV
ncbi:MAG: hypothetical protein KAT74_07140, partial [Candidatus Cloacimonetes bacterium]|nr:hypothetical protein [Candidatus Cloacimonadota bacterium]